MALDYAAIRGTLDFLLYDWLDTQALSQRLRFVGHDPATYTAVFELCERLAAEKFEPFNRQIDVQEPHFDGQRVHLPACTKAACAAYAASGMLSASQDEAVGGMQLPCVVEMAANSLLSAASIGLKAYSMLTAANAGLLMAHGTPAQKTAFAQPQLEGRFFGTMNLSEPQAGSSLSDITSRAVPDGPDHDCEPLGPRYRLTGRKMWISAGEHEMGENIIHLVLAKVPDAQGVLPAGTSGISLFAVPRYLVDTCGRLTGERNDVALAGLNHKLGYRGTTNTMMNYGEGAYPVRAPAGTDGKGAGAIGYRIGALGAGLRCMFHMMNEARIQVGLGASMLGYAGYLQSLDYARQRMQGRPLAPAQGVRKNTQQAPVAIIEHADVKRMLLAQKAYSEGALALQLYCARLIDEQRTGTEQAAERARLLLEILTPIAKSWPSEWCLEANSMAIQVLGGYGYTRDFPVEQHWRDNRLNMIHEGTHGIQGMDLLGRKVLMNDGAALALLLAKMQETVEAAQTHGSTADLALALAQAMEQIKQATNDAWHSANAQHALCNATHYLRAFGHVVLAWIWLELAVCAQRSQSSKQGLTEGKLYCARYFFAFELPLVSAWLKPISQHNTLLWEVPPDAL